MEAPPLHGRPGTKQLPLTEGRAVGAPIAFGLLASYVAVGLAGWIAAAVALLVAAPELAARDPLASQPVLAAHLVALGLLPFAVTAASFHLLPVLLRNDIKHPRRLQVALPLLAGGFLVAAGLAFDRAGLVWPGATMTAAGLALVLAELLGLVRRAPRNRTLVVSRTGVVISCLHVAAALALGALVFSHGDAPVAGISHERWVLAHLQLAVFGWLTVLIVTVGRTLGPMLAQAPAAPVRRFPWSEVALTAGLWTLLAGVLTASTPAALAGGWLILLTLALFARQMVRVARTRRTGLEAPLAHLLTGVIFLLQAAILGAAVLLGAAAPRTGLVAYVVLLLLGWAGGVTLGHIGKLLSLSLWVWWPPGPRPKQSALYPRRAWLAEAAAYAIGVELLGAGALAGNTVVARTGGVLLIVAAVLAADASRRTWSCRPRGSPNSSPGQSNAIVAAATANAGSDQSSHYGSCYVSPAPDTRDPASDRDRREVPRRSPPQSGAQRSRRLFGELSTADPTFGRARSREVAQLPPATGFRPQVEGRRLG